MTATFCSWITIPKYQHSAGKSNDRIRHFPRGTKRRFVATRQARIEKSIRRTGHSPTKLLTSSLCIAKTEPRCRWLSDSHRSKQNFWSTPLSRDSPRTCTTDSKDHRHQPTATQKLAMAFHLHAAAFIAASLHRHDCRRLLKFTIEVIAQQQLISTNNYRFLPITHSKWL